jgi:hypothetical protein
MLLLTLSVQTKTKSWQQSRLFVKLVDSIAPSYVMSVTSLTTGRRQLISVARRPKFRPKSSKRAEEKKLAGRIHGRNLAECYQKWQKGGRKKFSKEILNFTVMTNTQRQR